MAISALEMDDNSPSIRSYERTFSIVWCVLFAAGRTAMTVWNPLGVLGSSTAYDSPEVLCWCLWGIQIISGLVFLLRGRGGLPVLTAAMLGTLSVDLVAVLRADEVGQAVVGFLVFAANTFLLGLTILLAHVANLWPEGLWTEASLLRAPGLVSQWSHWAYPRVAWLLIIGRAVVSLLTALLLLFVQTLVGILPMVYSVVICISWAILFFEFLGPYAPWAVDLAALIVLSVLSPVYMNIFGGTKYWKSAAGDLRARLLAFGIAGLRAPWELARQTDAIRRLLATERSFTLLLRNWSLDRASVGPFIRDLSVRQPVITLMDPGTRWQGEVLTPVGSCFYWGDLVRLLVRRATTILIVTNKLSVGLRWELDCIDSEDRGRDTLLLACSERRSLVEICERAKIPCCFTDWEADSEIVKWLGDWLERPAESPRGCIPDLEDFERRREQVRDDR